MMRERPPADESPVDAEETARGRRPLRKRRGHVMGRNTWSEYCEEFHQVIDKKGEPLYLRIKVIDAFQFDVFQSCGGAPPATYRFCITPRKKCLPR